MRVAYQFNINVQCVIITLYSKALMYDSVTIIMFVLKWEGTQCRSPAQTNLENTLKEIHII